MGDLIKNYREFSDSCMDQSCFVDGSPRIRYPSWRAAVGIKDAGLLRPRNFGLVRRG